MTLVLGPYLPRATSSQSSPVSSLFQLYKAFAGKQSLHFSHNLPLLVGTAHSTHNSGHLTMGQKTSSERISGNAQLTTTSQSPIVPSANAHPTRSLSALPTEILLQIIVLTYDLDPVSTLCLSLSSNSFLFLVHSLFGHLREENYYSFCCNCCSSWKGKRAILGTEIQTALGRLRPRITLQGYDYASDLTYLVTRRSRRLYNDDHLHADYARARQLLCQDHPTPTSRPPFILMIPQELISKILNSSYDSDPVSTVCLALTSHHFREIIPPVLNIALPELVRSSCNCLDCKWRKAMFLEFFHRFQQLRNDPSRSWNSVDGRLIRSIAVLQATRHNHAIPERERLLSLLDKDKNKNLRQGRATQG